MGIRIRVKPLSALYLSRFSYTPETWARLVTNPEDRRKAAQEKIESSNGRRELGGDGEGEQRSLFGRPASDSAGLEAERLPS